MGYEEFKQKARDLNVRFVEPIPQKPVGPPVAVCGECGQEIFEKGNECLNLVRCPFNQLKPWGFWDHTTGKTKVEE